MTALKNKITKQKFRDINSIILIISILGIVLRIYHLIYNRSLWMDEIYLCSSFFNTDYINLVSNTLDYGQKAPIGFLFAVKFITSHFGSSEIALRFIPFLSGIISLLLFIKVCRHFLQPPAQIVALIIFSFAPAIIYHAVEAKQYSTECLTTVLALYLFIIYNEKTDWISKMLWALIGAILLWFSYSAVFVLTGMALALCVNYLITKNYRLMFINMLPFVAWMTSFLVNYYLFTYKHNESEWIVYWFKAYDYFMPFPPENLQQLKWFPRNLFSMMDYPLGLSWKVDNVQENLTLKILAVPLIPVLMLFTGVLTLAWRKRELFLILILPVVLMSIASAINLYPLRERFWMFISPVLILLISFGYEYFNRNLRSRRAGLLLFLLIIIGPVIQSTYYLIQPSQFYKHKKSYESEALTYIDQHFKEGDVVYNYWNNSPGYDVYKRIKDYRFEVIQGQDYRFEVSDIQAYNIKLGAEFKQFKGAKRLWLIYNTQFTTTIGDLIDQPYWYYKGKALPVDNLQQQAASRMTLLNKIVYSDLSICLYSLTP